MRTFIIILLLLSAIGIHASPIPANKLYKMPYISSPELSPDGRFISARIAEDNSRYLVLIDASSLIYYPVLSFNNTQRLTSYHWLDGTHLYLEYLENRVLQKAIGQLDTTDDKVTVSVLPRKLSGNLVAKLADNQVLYAVTPDKDDEQLVLYKVSIEQLKQQQFSKHDIVESQLPNVQQYFYDTNSSTLFALQYKADTEQIVFSYRKITGKQWLPLLTLTEEDLNHTLQPISLLPDNKLAVLSNRDSDTVALYEFDIKTQALGKVLYQHPDYDLIDANVTTGGDIISVSFIENGQRTTLHFDTSSQQQNALLAEAFPNKLILTLSDNPKLRKNLLLVTASDMPGTYYLYDKDTNKASRLSSINPDLESYKLAPSISYRVTTEPGIEIEAYLTLPVTAVNNKVLLVMPHGGPVGVRDYTYFNPQTQYLVSRGFSILRVNFRGSSGYGKQFLQGGVAQFGQAIEKDIAAAVKHVRGQHTFDKMCAAGSSYGGYSAVMLAISHPEEYDCAIGAYGIYDLPLLFNASNLKVTEQFRSATRKTVGDNRAELLDYSPVYLAEKLQSPVLLIAGYDDQIADFEHSQRISYVLNKLGKPHETLFYKHTGHGHDTFIWEQHEQTYIADYLQRTLKLPAYHKLPELSSEQLSIVAEDYVMLADGYKFGRKLISNKTKAAHFYALAAELNHARAAYNLALHYLNLSPQPDNETALFWLKRSAELGYEVAYFELGNWYRKGIRVTADHQQAFDYYQQAHDLKHDLSAQIMQAELYCFGQGVSKDFAQCLELLKLRHLRNSDDKELAARSTSQARRTQRNAIAAILTHAKLTSAERQQVLQLLSEERNIAATPMTLYKMEKFAEIDSNDNTSRNQQSSEAYSTNTEQKMHIGVNFKANFNWPENRQSVGVIASWEAQTADSRWHRLDDILLWSRQREGWSTSFTYGQSDKIYTALKLTISDLNGKVLHSEQFSAPKI